MERRAEPRFPLEQDVSVTLLGNPSETVTARLSNLSGRGALLLMSNAPPLNSPVRIAFNDRLLLGEVCHVGRSAEGYTVGIQLHSSLTALTDLHRLVAAVMGVREEERVQTPHRSGV